jgi:hypothetical protein
MRSSPHAPPDEQALEALPDVYLAPFGDGGETSCNAVSTMPRAALLDRAGVACPPRPHDPDGPAPCTVCGAFVGLVSHGYLVLPATSNLHTISAGLSNGTQQILTFEVAAQAPGGGAVELKLPRLPREVRYVDGPALGYGYGH